MGPRPQGGVRCCLGKPFAPVTIVAPDAGRSWPAWSSSRGGNCCPIPRSDTRFPTSRSRPGRSGRLVGKHLPGHGGPPEHGREHDHRTALAGARLGGCRRQWLTRAAVLRAELSRCGGQPGRHLPGTPAPLACWCHRDRNSHGTGTEPERHRAIQCLADASPRPPPGFRSTGVYYIRLVEPDSIGPGVELLQ